MAVRNSVQQSLRKKDPFFVPLTELSAARGDNEVAEALKKSVIRNVSTRLFNLLGEERKNFIASVTSDLNAAFGKVPSDLIGFLSLRGNFTDRQISAIVRDPNALAVQQGLKRFIKQANEKTAQIEQFILEERLSLEMAKLAKTMAFLSVGPVEGMSQRRLGIVALEFPSVAPAGPAAAASADSFATAQDAPYARLIEVLGGLKAIAGGLRLSLGETVANADEAYMEQLTKAVLDRLKPVMLECFAEVDLDAHDRFLHEYPSYVDLRSKQQVVMEKARLTWGTVLEKVIHDQLNQGALARSA
jgi:hypothetical protein